ncbi:hypothetical protein GRI89_07240 [Altererythrobacter salegens]|uniref:Transferrin-binding protein B C-lobe/N-lobe beta-barrel domain-containing protein n=1 Tax=Croceibacterium salegens TaxID=1737568 RepID=A0A6I4STJ4_9SPHN|nr:transferrin-binding protein-like solute binding protein [Croceibacterium salegens]MXO59334.1 hypothetical protein [Croceibacterium salegens]
MTAVNGTATVDPGTTLTTSGSQGTTSLTFSYDASSKTYTVKTSAHESSFGDSADRAASGTNAFQVYDFKATSGTATETLNLYHGTLDRLSETKRVSVGMWYSVDGNQLKYEIFLFGFPSASGEIPTTGKAQFAAAVYGIYSETSKEPYVFQEDATALLDFDRGVFTIEGKGTNDTSLYTGTGRGTVTAFRASGQLSSTGNLSGTFSYENASGVMAGPLHGNFFGPGAEEFGGTFASAGMSGQMIAGGFLGVKTGAPQSNISLSDFVTDQHYFLPRAEFFNQRHHSGGGTGYGSVSLGNSGFQQSVDGTYWVSGYNANEGQFGAADKVSGGDPSFITYARTIGDIDYGLKLYDGPVDGVRLTYVNFAEYFQVVHVDTIDGINRSFFPFGIETLNGVLAGLTGTGTYKGIAYGAATNTDGSRRIDVTGTSQFDFDFANLSLTGWLELAGTDLDDSSSIDFGRFDLAQTVAYRRNAIAGDLLHGGTDVGDIQLRFYGPTGEEIGGAFGIGDAYGMPGTLNYTIGGATIGKRD